MHVLPEAEGFTVKLPVIHPAVGVNPSAYVIAVEDVSVGENVTFTAETDASKIVTLALPLTTYDALAPENAPQADFLKSVVASAPVSVTVDELSVVVPAVQAKCPALKLKFEAVVVNVVPTDPDVKVPSTFMFEPCSESVRVLVFVHERL